MFKSMGLGPGFESWLCHLTKYVTWDKLLHLSGPRFPHLCNGIVTRIKGVDVRSLGQCLVCTEC